jgi:hypothetical protein
MPRVFLVVAIVLALLTPAKGQYVSSVFVDYTADTIRDGPVGIPYISGTLKSVVDGSGNLVVYDDATASLYVRWASGAWDHLVGGYGSGGFQGGNSWNSSLNGFVDMAFNSLGELYVIADSSCKVAKVGLGDQSLVQVLDTLTTAVGCNFKRIFFDADDTMYLTALPGDVIKVVGDSNQTLANIGEASKVVFHPTEQQLYFTLEYDPSNCSMLTMDLSGNVATVASGFACSTPWAVVNGTIYGVSSDYVLTQWTGTEFQSMSYDGCTTSCGYTIDHSGNLSDTSLMQIYSVGATPNGNLLINIYNNDFNTYQYVVVNTATWQVAFQQDGYNGATMGWVYAIAYNKYSGDLLFCDDSNSFRLVRDGVVTTLLSYRLGATDGDQDTAESYVARSLTVDVNGAYLYIDDDTGYLRRLTMGAGFDFDIVTLWTDPSVSGVTDSLHGMAVGNGVLYFSASASSGYGIYAFVNQTEDPQLFVKGPKNAVGYEDPAGVEMLSLTATPSGLVVGIDAGLLFIAYADLTVNNTEGDAWVQLINGNCSFLQGQVPNAAVQKVESVAADDNGNIYLGDMPTACGAAGTFVEKFDTTGVLSEVAGSATMTANDVEANYNAYGTYTWLGETDQLAVSADGLTLWTQSSGVLLRFAYPTPAPLTTAAVTPSPATPAPLPPLVLTTAEQGEAPLGETTAEQTQGGSVGTPSPATTVVEQTTAAETTAEPPATPAPPTHTTPAPTTLLTKCAAKQCVTADEISLLASKDCDQVAANLRDCYAAECLAVMDTVLPPILATVAPTFPTLETLCNSDSTSINWGDYCTSLDTLGDLCALYNGLDAPTTSGAAATSVLAAVVLAALQWLF